MPRFSDVFMDALLSRNDIATVVGSYVQLKPKGGRLWGCCPFHSEKTPSFSVSPDKQLYYCFGCHKGGTVIQFIMEAERLEFHESVAFLAERVGLELPDVKEDESFRRERLQNERLYAVLKAAALYYHQMLLSEEGKGARTYLARRGLTGATATKFGLGYAKAGWDNLMNHLKDEGYLEADLLLAGLLVKNAKTGRVYDAYRNRVLFPIIGVNGKVLGFGARAMGDEMPKYINTGDTSVYNKRNNLYALNLQKGSKHNALVIVEGYMDVIALFQAGVTNAVASLGTALTKQQARLIKRFVTTVYIAYDGDMAGQNAMLRGLDILSDEGLDVRVIVLPGGKDPDDFIRENGKEAFDVLRDKALTLHGFRLTCMARARNLKIEDEREAFAKEACALIGTLEPVEQTRYYSFVSRMTGMDKDTLRLQGKRSEGTGNAAHLAVPGDKRIARMEESAERPTNERTRVEETMFVSAMASKEAATLASNFEFENVQLKTAFKALSEEYERSDVINPSMFLASMNTAESHIVAQLIQREMPLEPIETMRDCLRTLQAAEIDETIAALQQRMREVDVSTEEKKMLTEECFRLMSARKSIY